MKLHTFLLQSDGGIMCLLGIGVLIAIAIISSNAANRKKKEMLEAEANYRELLSLLKANPTNPNLRERTLAHGRIYSNLTRDNKGVTIYDEMALMNDINAACAAANVSRPFVEKAKPKESIEERLSKLEGLKNRNLISQSEYESRRSKILDEI